MSSLWVENGSTVYEDGENECAAWTNNGRMFMSSAGAYHDTAPLECEYEDWQLEALEE